MPLVSVIVPTYNSAPFLATTVRSALAQRDAQQNLAVEVIVIDDGSSDDIAGAIASLPAEVRYVRKENGGVSSARNLGLQLANGEFICFLDADDVLAQGWFAEALQHFERDAEIGVVFGRFHRWHEQPGETLADAWRPLHAQDAADSITGTVAAEESGWIYHRMLLDSWILCSSAVVRKDVAEKAGPFEEGTPVGEDWDFWIRVSRIAAVAAINRTIVLYRQHPNSASRKLRDKNFAVDLILHAIHTYGWQPPSGQPASAAEVYPVVAKHCVWHAIDHFDRGRYSAGLRATAKALRYEPGRWKNWRLMAIGLLGLARPYAHRLKRRAQQSAQVV